MAAKTTALTVVDEKKPKSHKHKKQPRLGPGFKVPVIGTLYLYPMALGFFADSLAGMLLGFLPDSLDPRILAAAMAAPHAVVAVLGGYFIRSEALMSYGIGILASLVMNAGPAIAEPALSDE